MNSPTIETMKNKRLVVVLGMHRSGSSAITKGLEVLGVDLGSHLMAADASNAKGYFEDIEFNQLNSAILRAGGHEWYSLSRIDRDDFKADKFAPLKDRAKEFLESKLKDTDLLGLKDPRLCRLLPFWKDIFAALQLDTAYVIILRNPESIAASLFARDSFPRVKSLYLWLEHMIPVFQETSGQSRCVVDYEQLLSQPETVIQGLADELDLRARLDHAALHAYGSGFIDARLKHHQGKPDPETGFTPTPVGQLAGLLDRVSRRDISIDAPEFNQEIDSIDRAWRDRTDILAYIDTLDYIIIDWSRKLAEQGKRLKALSGAHGEATDALESTREKVARRESQIEGLKTEGAEKDEQLAALQDSLQTRLSKITSLERSLSDLHDQVKASEERLKILQLRYESSASEAQELAHQLDEMQSGLLWRTSFALRKPWDFLKQVFKPNKKKHAG